MNLDLPFSSEADEFIEDVAGKFLWCINDKPRAAIQKVLYWKKLVNGEPIMLIFHFIVDDLVTPKGK